MAVNNYNYYKDEDPDDYEREDDENGEFVIGDDYIMDTDEDTSIPNVTVDASPLPYTHKESPIIEESVSDSDLDLNALNFGDEEEEEIQDNTNNTNQADSTVQAYPKSRQLDSGEIGVFTLELLSHKKSSINAYWLLEAGLRLSPLYAGNKTGSKGEQKLAQILKANELVINELLSVQVIDLLLGVINSIPSFKSTELFRVMQEKKTIQRTTTVIMAGLLRVQGLQKRDFSTEDTVEHLLRAVSSIDIEKRNTEVKLSPVQGVEAQKSLTDNMTEEQRLIFEQEERERQAQIAKASKQFTESIEKEGLQGILNELNLRRESAGAFNANEIEGFTEEYKDYSKEIMESPYESMLQSTAFSIMDIYDQLFETVISLGKIFGALSFRNDTATVIQVTTKDNKIHLDSSNQKNKNSLVAGWFAREMAINYPTGKLICADTLQVPTLENLEAGYNCFPGFLLRYALGFVKKERHVKWTVFREALLRDVKDRLYQILNSTTGSGVSGEEWFNSINIQKNERLISAFTTGALILNGEVGLNNCQIRISSFGQFNSIRTGGARTSNFNQDPNLDLTRYLGSLTRSGVATAEYIDTKNASVQNRIIDILYLKDSNKYLNTPSWAYQALGRIYGGGLRPDPKEGIPIGRTLRGDLVYLRIAFENNRIIISIYAGSRSGKGVTTLSVLGAAYSGEYGVCYGDRKPDMAKIFWNIEREQPGLHIYALDATDSVPRLDANGVEHSAVNYLKSIGRLDCAEHVTAMLYLKNLQLLSLVAQARKMGYGAGAPMLWVLDEITLAAGDLRRLAEAKPSGKKKIEDGSKEEYLSKWYNFLDMAGSGMRSCILEAFGIANINVVMIGQIPGEELGIPGMQSRGPIGALFTGAEQQCNKYIVGRGLGAVSSYGSVALKRKSMQDFNAVENNRFFEIRNRAKANVGDEYESEVFKPFLTLNSDDIYDTCWTTGIGVQYGYDANIDKNGTPEQRSEMRARYEQLLNAEFGDPEHTNNGVVHKGVGFYGLLDTYMSYIEDSAQRQKEVNRVLGLGYNMTESIMKQIGLLGEGNVFGYSSVEDFIYDLDPEKCFMSLTDLQAYINRLGANPDETDGVNGEFTSESHMFSDEDGPITQPPLGEDRFFNQDGLEADTSNDIGMDGAWSDVGGSSGYEEDIADPQDFFRQHTESEEQEEAENDEEYYEQLEASENDVVRPQEKRGSKLFGAVAQTFSKHEPESLDEKTGQVRMDSKVYGVRLAGNLEDIDEKFNENHRFFNKYGSERHNRLRQQAIYKAIEKGKATRNCQKVYIGADGVLINDSYLLGAETYGDSSYYSILSNFNFVDFFSRFTKIEALTLDADAYELLIDECQFGFGALEKIFRLQPKLKYIEYPNIQSGKMLKLTRNTASRSEYVKYEEKRYNEEIKAKKILEESFLFGGSMGGNNGENSKILLYDNIKNRNRAQRVLRRGSSSSKSKRASNRLLRKAPLTVIVGGASLVGLMASGAVDWFRDTIRQAKEGF